MKGTSPRRSGRVECASTAGGLTVVPMLCEVAESFVSYFGSGVEQDDFDGCTMTFVEGCVTFMVCSFCLCSSTVSATITNPPSTSLSGVDFFESLRSPNKLHMIILNAVLVHVEIISVLFL